jgi:hypothetical protein
MSKTKTPPAKQAILEVLKVEPQATVAQIAVSAGVGRSTAGKLLAQLESYGEVRRTEGGRDGNRRLPDRWTLASSQPAPDAAPEKDAAPATSAASASNGERLKPGQLEGLILTYMQEHPTKPLGPGDVAKALQRSSGAVGNGLARLTRAQKVRQVNDRPRRYQIAS